MDEILNSVLQVAEILIIKRDFDLLKKIVTNFPSEMQLQLIPYTALFCYEGLEYLKKVGQEVQLGQISQYSIKDIRQKAKFFDLSLNKLFQCIENIDRVQNEYFANLMRFPELGKWNIHTNLGIYYDEHKNIVGNTHYAFYIFQDDKTICKPDDEMKARDIINKEIYDFAYDMGGIIGGISSGLSSISDFIRADFDPSPLIMHSQDFNTNRCFASENNIYKIVRLFLLHIVSNIGMILFGLKKSIVRDTGFLVRLEYITYHYSIMRLEKLTRYCNDHKNLMQDRKIAEMLRCFDYSDENELRRTEFRNCVMHFSLKDKEGRSLIDKDKLNLAIPFCGLVESQFGMTYNEYRSKLETQLSFLYETIREYLDFDVAVDLK
ncbi:MAG: hypothetical protein IJW67_11465 [Blautia sp.]|nr:hypothetical protein [Blautia sp.]